jgi:Calcineurin-like phosphoesterase
VKKALIVIAGIAELLATITLGGEEKIVGGPYTLGVTQRTATMVWIVQRDEMTLRPANGAATLTSPSLRVEKTTFTGLQPNTRYEYAIPGAGDAGTGYFRTSPPAGPVPYRFVVYGDTRTRHDVHQRVIGEVMTHGIPDFILHTGDLVADGNDSALWPIFFGIERELLRRTVFFPSLGNHERNAHYFSELFQEKTPYYSFDWGNGHFVIIDSDIENVGRNEHERNTFWMEQTRWLEDDLLAHQKSEYRFVVAHHPPFTAVTRRQGDNPHMTALVPIFEKYHVSAAFFGHDHNYQHYLKNGVHYVITGGGGAPLYDVDTPPAVITQKVASVENFVAVSVNGEITHVVAIAVGGRTLEEFDIQSARP